MAKFLRDVHLSNIKVTEDLLIQLTEVFVNRAQLQNNSITVQGDERKQSYQTFTIRFDGKGYRLFSLDELLQHFQRANNVERVIITFETSESLISNRLRGEYLEVRFDKLDEKSCYLSVTSDDLNWVDASYSAVQEVINKHQTKNSWARSIWSTITIQLLGVVVGFVLSLWAAALISPKFSFSNAYVITFFFAFLIFSNIWGYINTIILEHVHRTFPNIQFYRSDKDRPNWLIRTLIGGVILAFILYVLRNLTTYIGEFVV